MSKSFLEYQFFFNLKYMNILVYHQLVSLYLKPNMRKISYFNHDSLRFVQFKSHFAEITKHLINNTFYRLILTTVEMSHEMRPDLVFKAFYTGVINFYY